MNAKPYVASLLLVALFAGCARLPLVGPEHRAPDLPLPTAWSAAATGDQAAVGESLARWWRQLDDPDLDRLIAAALAGSPDLRFARARLRQARAIQVQAGSGLFPTLTVAGSASRSKNGAAFVSSGQTFYDAGFDAAWEIDLFGGIRRGIEAAAADEEASAADLEATQVSLVAEVARSYIEVRAFQRRLAIARDNLATQSETLQIADWRYQAGLATFSDVEQARSSREQTRAGIPDLETGLAAAENRLAVLLGLPPGELQAQLAAPRELPALPATIATGIPADILRQRPDLVAAERTLAAETARVGQRLAQRFPSLNLGGSFGWQSYRFAAFGGSDTLVRAISGTLAATLFDGGRLRAAVEIQSAVQEQALIAYENSVLLALEEVENALTAYAAGRERVAALRAAAEAARNAALLSRHLYESGLADFQEVLITERARLNAEDSLATAEAALRTSLIALYKALGGGWEDAALLAQQAKDTTKS